MDDEVVGVTDPRCGALEALRAAVGAVRFDVVHPSQRERAVRRDRLVKDLASIEQRLAHLDAPLLVVVGGVTGAGKSTFVNTVVGRDLLATGPVRPTTFAPALVCHPDDAEWFAGDTVLPGLARLEASHQTAVGGRADAGHLRLLRTAAVPPGLAVLDAPDVDSVSEANRELADQLLDAADLWLWFTTAGKYADEDSMAYLRRARQRRTALAVVLTQVHPVDAEEVAADFRAKLAAEQLVGARLFVIPVARVERGRLPPDVVAPLRDWLHALAEPPLRRAHRRQTTDGALAALPGEIDDLIADITDDLRITGDLLDDVERAYQHGRAQFNAALDEGLPLRADVVARWDRFVGAGKLLKATEAATGQARQWIRRTLANAGIGEEARIERQVRVEVADTLTGLLGQTADLAATEVTTSWSTSPAGRALVDDALGRRSDGFDADAQQTVRAWQQTVTERVESIGAARRTQARVLSGVVSVAATSAILVAMASSGLTGAEAGIAAAAGAANQALLVKLLGEANLRSLVADARRDLLERFDALMAAEARRFRAQVEAVSPEPAVVDRLRDARDAVAKAHGGG
ncbi:MAG TPA: dynamin family protein [Egibacteraceae bacterium]|nr:dynamin family protein [Egibacteraceae bacterium]